MSKFINIYFTPSGNLSTKFIGIKSPQPKNIGDIFNLDLLLEEFIYNIECANKAMDMPIELIQKHFLKKIVDCLKIINYKWFSVSDLIDILGYSSKINCIEFEQIINSIQDKYHTKYKDSDFPDEFNNNGYPIYWIDLVDSEENIIKEYYGVYEVLILIKELTNKE